MNHHLATTSHEEPDVSQPCSLKLHQARDGRATRRLGVARRHGEATSGVCVCVYVTLRNMYIYLSIYLSIYLTIYLSIYLSIYQNIYIYINIQYICHIMYVCCP